MTIDLESLGMTQEELQERVVNALCEKVLADVWSDDDEEESHPCFFRAKLESLVETQITERVSALAAKTVLPQLTELIEGATLQRTNEWGDKVGESVTFTAYLVQCAEQYLTEKVDHRGEPAGRHGHNTQTRIAHMIDEHLAHQIAKAMRDAVATVNSALAEGLAQTVKMKLAEITTALEVTTTTR